MSAPALAPSVDVRRAADRFATQLEWLDSRHSFSFGPHYDPANTSHGLLLVCNDDRVAAGDGYAAHPHRDVEIVTWVLEGSLVHQDSAGHRGVLRPGLAQRMSAGTGVVHSETNDAHLLDADQPREPVRFVQMWVATDEPGLAPAYEQREVDDALRSGALVPVASGMPRYDGTRAVHLRNRSAALHAARLAPGRAVELPEAPYVHVFVARGEAVLEGAGALAEGDAVRLTATGGQRVTATRPAELLVWEMHARVGG